MSLYFFSPFNYRGEHGKPSLLRKLLVLFDVDKNEKMTKEEDAAFHTGAINFCNMLHRPEAGDAEGMTYAEIKELWAKQ